MSPFQYGFRSLKKSPGLQLTIAATAAILSGCASSGPTRRTPAPERTRVTRGVETVEIFSDSRGVGSLVAAPVDSVWLALPWVYDRLEIPVAVSDPGQRTFGNSGYRAHRIEDELLSRYLDCGRDMGGQYADRYSVTLSVLTRLTETEGGTMVMTRVDASAQPRAVSGNPGSCASKSRLELRLVQLIIEVLEEGASVDTTLSPSNTI